MVRECVLFTVHVFLCDLCCDSALYSGFMYLFVTRVNESVVYLAEVNLALGVANP